MTDGFIVRVLGDFGPFSRMGKSIGYLLEVGGAMYLLDCGAPLFQQIGGHGLKSVSAMIITHCHDDHKRWFTDLALFNMYAPDIPHKACLISSEDVHADLIESSMPSLARSLSADSRSVVDIPYDAYIDFRMIGPIARYKIVKVGNGSGTVLRIVDKKGAEVGPERAKIVISKKTGRPRMLFRDPEYNEWVEPESFYAYSSAVFYDGERNVYRGDGHTIEAIKDPVWHGIPGFGVKFSTERESLIFSSDTIHDVNLWKQLCTDKRPQRLSMSRREFEAASIIYGDINDLIERTWSEERYRSALTAFDGAVVIHDISVKNSVVHTDYEKLDNTALRKEKVILTHSPDRMTSEWVLSNAGKVFAVKDGGFFELIGERLRPMDADIYHKEAGRYYVGYKNENGAYTVYEKGGLLRFESHDGTEIGRPLYKVDLYEDIGGRYFQKTEKENTMYTLRSDGQVELVEFTARGSSGRIVQDIRDSVQSVKTNKPVRLRRRSGQ